VALLGPDGAGKSTLAKELSQIDHLRAQLIYMGGNYEASNIGLPTTPWLKAQVRALHGTRWNSKTYLLKSMNYCNRLMDQWYRYAVGMYHKMLGRFVIFDRYSYDAYLSPPASTLGKRMRRWFLKHTCPPPDFIILLDAPGIILYQRKGEHSPEFLEKQRQTFLRLSDKITNMAVVDATRSASDIRRDAISMIWTYYGRRFFM
jgi:thymidylate kinase